MNNGKAVTERTRNITKGHAVKRINELIITRGSEISVRCVAFYCVALQEGPVGDEVDTKRETSRRTMASDIPIIRVQSGR